MAFDASIIEDALDMSGGGTPGSRERDQLPSLLGPAEGGEAAAAALREVLRDDEDDSAPYVPFPCRISSLDSMQIRSVAAGAAHSLAVSAAGECVGWGLATYGRLGVGREETLSSNAEGELLVETPQLLRGLAGYAVSTVACGELHSLACTADGQLLSWGCAAQGRLGFEEGALAMPLETDGERYQPLPRQVWPQDSHGEAAAQAEEAAEAELAEQEEERRSIARLSGHEEDDEWERQEEEEDYEDYVEDDEEMEAGAGYRDGRYQHGGEFRA